MIFASLKAESMLLTTTAVKSFSDFCQTLSSGQRVGDSLKEVPRPATYIAMVESAVARTKKYNRILLYIIIRVPLARSPCSGKMPGKWEVELG